MYKAYKNFTVSTIVIFVFFLYELLAMKYNFFSPSLTLLSFLTIKEFSSPSVNYENIVKSIIYNNPLYNSNITQFLYSVEIIGITNVVSYSQDYFYIASIKGIKVYDIVVNEQNFLGIVENVTNKLSRVRYIKSNSFQIPAKIKIENKEIFGFIKTSSKVYFYCADPKDNNLLIKPNFNLQVLTMGYFNIPSGIPIGILYNNEVKLFKEIQKTDQVIVIRKKQW